MLKLISRKAVCAMIVVMLVVMLTMESNVAVAKEAVTISNIGNVTKTVKVDDKVAMPATVVAVMSDKTKKKVAVKWNKTLNSDMDGTYTASGTVAGYSKKVTFTLKVTPPKLGTIKIPVVTDSTLKTPSNITLGVGKTTVGEEGSANQVEDTLPSVFWTPASSDADEYHICVYDQYKRIVKQYGIVLNEEDLSKMQLSSKLQLDKVKNLTISTITITPVKTTEEGRMTGDPSKNGTGETAVFECSVKVTANTGKTVTMKAGELENNSTAYGLSFSKKVAPYTYFELFSTYQFIGSDNYGMASRGEFSDQNGDMLFICLNNELDMNIYMGNTSKLSLRVYSDAVMESSNKGSYAITIYPVDYKAGTISASASKNESNILMPVQGLTAKSIVTGTVEVAWSSDYEQMLSGYQVYYATSKSGKYTKLATVKTNYYKGKLSAGKTYYIKVRAYVKEGEETTYGKYSDAVKVTVLKKQSIINIIDSGKAYGNYIKVSDIPKEVKKQMKFVYPDGIFIQLSVQYLNKDTNSGRWVNFFEEVSDTNNPVMDKNEYVGMFSFEILSKTSLDTVQQYYEAMKPDEHTTFYSNNMDNPVLSYNRTGGTGIYMLTLANNPAVDSDLRWIQEYIDMKDDGYIMMISGASEWMPQ